MGQTPRLAAEGGCWGVGCWLRGVNRNSLFSSPNCVGLWKGCHFALHLRLGFQAGIYICLHRVRGVNHKILMSKPLPFSGFSGYRVLLEAQKLAQLVSAPQWFSLSQAAFSFVYFFSAPLKLEVWAQETKCRNYNVWVKRNSICSFTGTWERVGWEWASLIVKETALS